MKAIAYCRKSNKVNDVDIEKSVEYQKLAITDYAKKNNIEISKFYFDVGISGKTLDRPGLNNMLVDIKNNMDTTVGAILLIYSADRLSRDLGNSINVLMKITEHIDRVIFVVENMDTSAEYFRMTYPLFAALAQEERDLIIKRTADGRKSKVLKRKEFIGTFNPLGFTKKYVKENETSYKRLVPATPMHTDNLGDLQELRILEYIFYAFNFGASLRNIAKQLNINFGPTRRGVKWNYKSVQYILSNQSYLGILKGRLEKSNNYYLPTDKITPIINPLFFQLTQLKLKNLNVGRRKKEDHTPPAYILCKKCANSIPLRGTTYYCDTCKGMIDRDLLHMKVISNVEILIKSGAINNNKRNSIDQMCQSIEYIQVKLQRKLNELESRRSDLQAVNENSNTYKELLKANTMASVNIKIEITYYSSVYNYLIELKEENTHEINISENFFLKLPYIVVVDFVHKIIQVAFHPKVILMNGGNE